MSTHPLDQEEIVSLASAALTAAAADAALPDSGLIFRDEWLPETRTRGGSAPRTNQPSWAEFIRSQLPGYEPTQRLPGSQRAGSEAPVLDAQPTSPSTFAPRSTSTSVLPPELEDLTGPAAELVARNRDLFDAVINHPFPRAFGAGTASLDGFRYYMIQDILYLQTCTRIKLTAAGSITDWDILKAFGDRHDSSLRSVKKTEEICLNLLGIPETVIETTVRSTQLEEIDELYTTTVQGKDANLAYFVVLLPCVLTYWTIAAQLMKDSSTAKNVVYHDAWTVVNHDRSSVVKYNKFINANIAAKGGINRWNDTFKAACRLEAKLFNTGLNPSGTPFHIISEGTHFLHMSSAENIVLAIENVADFSRPPLDKLVGYFPSNAESCVVGRNQTGRDNEKWLVVATKAGYTFKNMGTDLYLAISTESGKEGRLLQAAGNPYYWWINPASSQPTQGSPVHQISDSVNLRYTLHAVNVIDGYTPVIARENSQAACQLWSLNDKRAKDPPPVPRPVTTEVPKGVPPFIVTVSKAERILHMEAADTDRLAKRMAEEEEGERKRQVNIDWAAKDKAREEEEARTAKTRALLRAKNAQICHWEPLSGAFRSGSFNPAPIKSGVRNGLSTFIMRVKTSVGNVHDGVILDIQEGTSFTQHTHSATGTSFSDYQVLVGDQSRLRWVLWGHHKTRIDEANDNPVLGWDAKEGETKYTQFIARRSHLDQVPRSITWGKLNARITMGGYENRDPRLDYDVLCYGPGENAATAAALPRIAAPIPRFD